MVSRTVASFDAIGPVYDLLASVAFMGRVKRSQQHFLKRLPPATSVLVVGGGSGWILEDIARHLNPDKICYVEASAWMLQRAQRRKVAGHITYVHGTEKDIPAEGAFDLVITNFFLDMFDERGVRKIAERMHHHLSNDGTWLVTDFTCGNMFHRILLSIMYLFFLITTGLQQRRLPAWHNVLSASGFQCLEEATFFAGFMKSCIFKRRHIQQVRN